MAYVMVQHNVENYDNWKRAFDDHASFRKGAGSMGGFIMRDEKDPNQLTVLLRWDNLSNARSFAESPELKEAMQSAGVTSPPIIAFLDEAARPTV